MKGGSGENRNFQTTISESGLFSAAILRPSFLHTCDSVLMGITDRQGLRIRPNLYRFEPALCQTANGLTAAATISGISAVTG